MISVTTPSPWNSVHRPIEYVYNHDTQFISGVLVNAGRLEVYLTGSFTFTTPVGAEMLLTGVNDAGVSIDGIYDVYSVAGSVIVLDKLVTTPTLAAGVNSLAYIRLPEIKLYAGYLSGEEYPVDLPLELVATFTAENSPDNDVRFDVSEYLKSIFTIVPPVAGIDFNMFNRFRLHFDGAYKDYYMVLNSSIKTSDLMALYVNTGAYLNSQIPPIIFGCGKTILSTLQGSVVVNVEFDGDVPGAGDYNNDFSNDFNNE